MSQNSDAISGSPCLCVPHRCPQLAAEWRLAYRQYSPSWLSAHKIFSAHCYRFEHCQLVFQKNMQFSCALYWTKCAAQNGDCHGFGFTWIYAFFVKICTKKYFYISAPVTLWSLSIFDLIIVLSVYASLWQSTARQSVKVVWCSIFELTAGTGQIVRQVDR